jgi:hypothetical protein
VVTAFEVGVTSATRLCREHDWEKLTLYAAAHLRWDCLPTTLHTSAPALAFFLARGCAMLGCAPLARWPAQACNASACVPPRTGIQTRFTPAMALCDCSFCVKCKVSVCMHCMLFGKHKGHDGKSLQRAVQEGRDWLALQHGALVEQFELVRIALEKNQQRQREVRSMNEALQSDVHAKMEEVGNKLDEQVRPRNGLARTATPQRVRARARA